MNTGCELFANHSSPFSEERSWHFMKFLKFPYLCCVQFHQMATKYDYAPFLPRFPQLDGGQMRSNLTCRIVMMGSPGLFFFFQNLIRARILRWFVQILRGRLQRVILMKKVENWFSIISRLDTNNISKFLPSRARWRVFKVKKVVKLIPETLFHLYGLFELRIELGSWELLNWFGRSHRCAYWEFQHSIQPLPLCRWKIQVFWGFFAVHQFCFTHRYSSPKLT